MVKEVVMKNRSKSRETIMIILYQTYIYENKKMEYNIDEVIKENLETSNNFVIDTVKDIIEKQLELSLLANKYLENWNIDRLSKVDKAILSLGIYELVYTDTPNIVCINEAIELSKAYSDDKVVKMINGVLDNVYHKEVENEQS
jgi:N utilization substance protein B